MGSCSSKPEETTRDGSLMAQPPAPPVEEKPFKKPVPTKGQELPKPPVEEKPVEEEPEKKMTLKGAANLVEAANAFKSAGKPAEDEPVEEKPVEEEPEKKMTLKGAANLVKAANAFKSAGKPAEDEPVEDKPKKEPEAEAPKLTEKEPVEERATSEVDALDDEEKAMMSGKQEDFRSTKNNDEDAPASAFFTVMKRPRGVMVITSAKQRIIIIHKGHVRYYKTDAKLDTEAPYISTPPQGEIKGGVKGCMITPIVQDTSNCSIRVMVPPSAGKNMHLDLTFSSEEQVANFVDLFEKHKAYYETREVTQAA